MDGPEIAPEVLTWISEALRGERNLLNRLLEQRHEGLLSQLEVRLGSQTYSLEPLESSLTVSQPMDQPTYSWLKNLPLADASSSLHVAPAAHVEARALLEAAAQRDGKLRSEVSAWALRGGPSLPLDIPPCDPMPPPLPPLEALPTPEDISEESRGTRGASRKHVMDPFSQQRQISGGKTRISEMGGPQTDEPGQGPTTPGGWNFALSSRSGPRTPGGSFVKQRTQTAFAARKEAAAHTGLILWVNSITFELLLAVAIVLSAATMVVEAQHRGALDYAGTGLGGFEAHNLKPGSEMPVAFAVLDWIFGSIFAVEVLLKIAAYRCKFLTHAWHIFDTAVAIAWAVDKFGSSLAANPLILRMVRILRVVRLLRLTKSFAVFDSLNLMVTTLMSSTAAAFWAIMLLLGIMLCFALVMIQMLHSVIIDEDYPEDVRREVFRYFGTSSRAMLSMFEITLANWPPITRFLQDNVSEWYALVVLTYRCVVGYAMINVISGVFIHETFKVVQNHDDIMIMSQAREAARFTNKLNVLFTEADESEDGELTYEEFVAFSDHPGVAEWFSALGLDVKNTEHIWIMLAGSTKQSLDAEELVQGVMKLKGQARSIDLFALQKESRRAHTRLEKKLNKQLMALSSFLGTPITIDSPRKAREHLFGQRKTDDSTVRHLCTAD